MRWFIFQSCSPDEQTSLLHVLIATDQCTSVILTSKTSDFQQALWHYPEGLIGSLSGLICCHLCLFNCTHDVVISSYTRVTEQVSIVGNITEHSVTPRCIKVSINTAVWYVPFYLFQTHWWRSAAALVRCSACSSASVTTSIFSLLR